MARPRPIPFFGHGRDRFRPTCAVSIRRIQRRRSWTQHWSREFISGWVAAPYDNPCPVKPGINRTRAHYGRRRK
jgi:hypothetical protein